MRIWNNVGRLFNEIQANDEGISKRSRHVIFSSQVWQSSQQACLFHNEVVRRSFRNQMNKLSFLYVLLCCKFFLYISNDA